MSARALTLAAALMLAWPTPRADAHPHSGIDIEVELQFWRDGNFAGLKQFWIFDEAYTAYTTTQAKGGRAGKPDPKKLADTAREMLKNLKEYGYFTRVEQDGKRLALSDARDPAAELRDARLVVSFVLPLQAVADVRAASHAHRLGEFLSQRVAAGLRRVERRSARRDLRIGLVALCVAALSPALAQHPLIPQAPAGAAAAPATAASEPPGPLTRVTAWIHAKQRELHRELVRNMRALSANSTTQAGWALILASFLYGVFHAVGPGHGKAVLATYLGTQPHRLNRGLQLAAAGAFAQGAVAVTLVYGLVIVGGWLPRDTQDVVNWSERLGFALIAAVGFALALRGARALWAWWRGAGGHAHHHHAPAAAAHREHAHHDHGHHDHGHAHHDHDHDHRDHAHHGHAHHDHGHVHGPHCDHLHAPTPEMLATSGWRANLAIVLSMGLRPCTGAILVLVLAFALDMLWVGVFSVMAMSLGTGIALIAMGIIVIKARQWAMARLGAHEGQAHLAMDGLAFVGGCAVMLLGTSLLLASFGPAHPLGL